MLVLVVAGCDGGEAPGEDGSGGSGAERGGAATGTVRDAAMFRWWLRVPVLLLLTLLLLPPALSLALALVSSPTVAVAANNPAARGSAVVKLPRSTSLSVIATVDADDLQ